MKYQLTPSILPVEILKGTCKTYTDTQKHTHTHTHKYSFIGKHNNNNVVCLFSVNRTMKWLLILGLKWRILYILL